MWLYCVMVVHILNKTYKWILENRVAQAKTPEDSLVAQEKLDYWNSWNVWIRMLMLFFVVMGFWNVWQQLSRLGQQDGVYSIQQELDRLRSAQRQRQSSRTSRTSLEWIKRVPFFLLGFMFVLLYYSYWFVLRKRIDRANTVDEKIQAQKAFDNWSSWVWWLWIIVIGVVLFNLYQLWEDWQYDTEGLQFENVLEQGRYGYGRLNKQKINEMFILPPTDIDTSDLRQKILSAVDKKVIRAMDGLKLVEGIRQYEAESKGNDADMLLDSMTNAVDTLPNLRYVEDFAKYHQKLRDLREPKDNYEFILSRAFEETNPNNWHFDPRPTGQQYGSFQSVVREKYKPPFGRMDIFRERNLENLTNMHYALMGRRPSDSDPSSQQVWHQLKSDIRESLFRQLELQNLDWSDQEINETLEKMLKK